mmetsp:Transcript_10130/g.23700  ORF Transcript_10130/g.23700 Transcript_10130/m.23700 type:complete len:283 (-) Transcript_10130:1022-1870(-)
MHAKMIRSKNPPPMSASVMTSMSMNSSVPSVGVPSLAASSAGGAPTTAGDSSTHDFTSAVMPRPMEEGSKPEHASAGDASIPVTVNSTSTDAARSCRRRVLLSVTLVMVTAEASTPMLFAIPAMKSPLTFSNSAADICSVVVIATTLVSGRSVQTPDETTPYPALHSQRQLSDANGEPGAVKCAFAGLSVHATQRAAPATHGSRNLPATHCSFGHARSTARRSSSETGVVVGSSTNGAPGILHSERLSAAGRELGSCGGHWYLAPAKQKFPASHMVHTNSSA